MIAPSRDTADRYAALGLLHRDGTRLAVTDAGIAVLDGLLGEVVADGLATDGLATA